MALRNDMIRWVEQYPLNNSSNGSTIGPGSSRSGQCGTGGCPDLGKKFVFMVLPKYITLLLLPVPINLYHKNNVVITIRTNSY